jgi:riboflavin biosynthesis pyrimidine reductase
MCNYRLHKLNSREGGTLTSATSRDLVAVLQMTLDGRILDADGGSAWVDSWADGLELLPPVNGFVLGAGMFSAYEQFWTAMLEDPAAAAEMLGRDPYPREIAYAELAAQTEHLVLSATLADVTWPSARIVRSIEEIRTFKHDDVGAVYVVGGPTLITSLLDAGLLDELRLIVHPILVGDGPSLTNVHRSPQHLQLVAAEPAAGGRVTLAYRPARAG